jgi:hypothetical protein
MLSRDLLLSSDGDIAIIKNDLLLTIEAQTIEQRIRQELLTFKGEWFLDEELGIPYFKEILGSKNSIETIKNIFVNAIQNIDGVAELIKLDIQLETLKRIVSIEFSVRDAENHLTENNLIEMRF